MKRAPILLLFTIILACGGKERGQESTQEAFPSPIQSIDQCSLLTTEDVAEVVQAKVATSPTLVPMMTGGQGCLYDTDSAFDQITVFVADNWKVVFEQRKRDPQAEPLNGIGDAAFIQGKGQISVLVASQYLSVGARVAVPSRLDQLKSLAKRATSRLSSQD